MEDKDNLKTTTRKKTFKRVIRILLGILLLLVLFVVFAIPAILSSGKVRQLILSKINNSVKDGKTGFSDLSVGWLKGVSVADFSYDDNAGWISVKVKNISTKPHYGALLAGNLNFGQTQIDTPQVEINMKNRDSGLGTRVSNSEPRAASHESQFIALATDIHLNDGNVKLTGMDSKTVELAQINTNVNVMPPGKQSSFNLGMVVAANNEKSNVEVKGNVTPAKKSGWTMKNADGDLSVTVSKLDLESLESIFALAGTDIQAKGNISLDLKGRLRNGQLENLSGSAKGSNLDISGTALQGDSLKTKVLDARVNLSHKNQMINFDNLNIVTDWAEIKASGQMPTSIKSLDSFLASESNYDLNAVFNCNVAALVAQLPKTIGLIEGTTISSGRINGDISTSGQAGKKQIQAVAQLTDLKGMVEGKEIGLSAPVKLQALVLPDKTGININKLDLSASFASLDCSGNIESIKYNAKTDLAKLQSELGQFINLGEYKMTGAFVSKGTVSLNEEKYAASGSMEISNLSLSSKEKGSVSEPKANINFALDLNNKNNVLTAETLKVGTSFGQFNADGAKVPLNNDSAEQLKATVLASNVDLGKLKPYAIMFASQPKEMELSGIAQSEIAVSSQKQVYTFKSDSTKIKDLKLTYPGKKPFDQNSVSAAFVAELDTVEKTYGVRDFQLISPNIKIDYGRFSQTNSNGKTKLEGQADLEYDWSAVTVLASEFLPEELSLKGKRKDKISFSSEYPTGQTDKLMANLNAKAGFGFQQAGYMGMDIGRTEIGITVTNGVLDIPPFSTTVNEGKLNFAAKADFKKQPALFETGKPMQIVQDIKINDQMAKELLKYLNPIFANVSKVNGIANLNCEKLIIPLDSDAKNKAEIAGTVSVSQLQMHTTGILGQILTLLGQDVRSSVVTIHPTKFTLIDGFIKYDNMQMDVGNNPVQFEGVIGLDNSLDMTVTLPYTFRGTTARVGDQNTGRITLPLTGTVDNPQLDTRKFLEESLKQELPNLIQKGLEELFK